MTTEHRAWEARRLKSSRMHIKKRFEEEKILLSNISGRICWIFLHVKHQKVVKRKTSDRTIKFTYYYAQLKNLHFDCWNQVYMYSSMYVDPQIISVEDYFPTTKSFVVNYKKISTPGPFPKHWLVFSYIYVQKIMS